jgi:single stranded DNA-binding protein
MSTLKNKVQLIGHVGNDPEIKTFDGGKKLAKLNVATNENYKNEKGEKVEETQWHSLIAFIARESRYICSRRKELTILIITSYEIY